MQIQCDVSGIGPGGSCSYCKFAGKVCVFVPVRVFDNAAGDTFVLTSVSGDISPDVLIHHAVEQPSSAAGSSDGLERSMSSAPLDARGESTLSHDSASQGKALTVDNVASLGSLPASDEKVRRVINRETVSRWARETREREQALNNTDLRHHVSSSKSDNFVEPVSADLIHSLSGSLRRESSIPVEALSHRSSRASSGSCNHLAPAAQSEDRDFPDVEQLVRDMSLDGNLSDNAASSGSCSDPGLAAQSEDETFPNIEQPFKDKDLDADRSDTSSTDTSSASSSELASTASLQEVEHPLSHMKIQIIFSLLEQYDSYRKAQNGQPSESKAAATSASGQGLQGKEGKRSKKRATDPDGVDDGSGSGGSPSKRRKTPGEDSMVHPWLACPFAKKDPFKYSDCLRKRLRRIRDVKQHLRRCHSRPIYCSICGETFRTEEDRDTHARLRSCQETQYRIDGITKAQQDKLTEKSPLKTSEEAQWLAMFAIVFPECQPPCSAYIDPDLSEETQSFRDYVTREGPAALLNHMRPNHVWNHQDEALVGKLLRDGLEILIRRWYRDRPPLEQAQTTVGQQLLPAASQILQTQTITPAIVPLAPAAAVFTAEVPARVDDDFPSAQYGLHSLWAPSSTDFAFFDFGDDPLCDPAYLPSLDTGPSSTALSADMDGAPGPSSRPRPTFAYGHVRGDMEHFGMAKA